MNRIIDFIKSWFYYPKLKKWFEDRNSGAFSLTRFQYALKHYKTLKEFENRTKYEDLVGWKNLYQNEPVSNFKESE